MVCVYEFVENKRREHRKDFGTGHSENNCHAGRFKTVRSSIPECKNCYENFENLFAQLHGGVTHKLACGRKITAE